MSNKPKTIYLFIRVFLVFIIAISIIAAAELTPAQKEAERIKNNQIIDDEFHYTEFKTPEALNISLSDNSNKTQENNSYLLVIIFLVIVFCLILFAIIILKKKTDSSKFRG